MTYARRKDKSHVPIAQGFIAAGFSVADTSRLGDDFPDLVIGKYGITALLECKSEDRRRNGPVPATKLLSEGQKSFADTWKGSPVIIAYTFEDAQYKFNLLLKRLGWTK